MMDKVRVHEIAKELGINSKEVVDKAATMWLNVKTASSSVSIEEAEQIMNYIMSGASTESSAPKAAVKAADVEEVVPVAVIADESKVAPAVQEAVSVAEKVEEVFCVRLRIIPVQPVCFLASRIDGRDLQCLRVPCVQ